MVIRSIFRISFMIPLLSTLILSGCINLRDEICSQLMDNCLKFAAEECERDPYDHCLDDSFVACWEVATVHDPTVIGLNPTGANSACHDWRPPNSNCNGGDGYIGDGAPFC